LLDYATGKEFPLANGSKGWVPARAADEFLASWRPIAGADPADKSLSVSVGGCGIFSSALDMQSGRKTVAISFVEETRGTAILSRTEDCSTINGEPIQSPGETISTWLVPTPVFYFGFGRDVLIAGKSWLLSTSLSALDYLNRTCSGFRISAKIYAVSQCLAQRLGGKTPDQTISHSHKIVLDLKHRFGEGGNGRTHD
jgi:hypothetical protein